MSAAGPSPGPDHSLQATLAGWTVALELATAESAAATRRLLARFPARVGDIPAATLAQCAPGAPRPAPAQRVLPEVRRAPDGGLRLEAEDYTVQLSGDGARALVTGAGMFPVETALKVMLGAELARRGGLLIHGVGVAHSGRAALFVGHSGAGKSTLGTLWRDADGLVLADELVALWPDADAGTWRAAGTPWNLLGTQSEATLTAVGTLAWDAPSRWEAQGAGDVARVLLLNALLPESSSAGRSAMIASASRLLSEVPTGRLHFSRDSSAATVLRARLEATLG
ncbi:hypothetical protein [Citreicoccus inhibens]|uniref:hypothetical protein n=1 Tax=Citreicoccus inhibens TaxID=2849499 RepID=UPI002E2BE49B|nr:hypothetical protein [Citreicoccus inhibens]